MFKSKSFARIKSVCVFKPYFLVVSSSLSILFSTHEQIISTAITVFSLSSMDRASTLFCSRYSCSVNTGTSHYAFPSDDLYKGFGSTREYHGGTESTSPKTLSFSKSKIWRQHCALKVSVFRKRRTAT